jgi:AraC-like DNA-binding protein
MKRRVKNFLATKPSRLYRPPSSILDLLYLGWGHRFYGRPPQFSCKYTGWSYTLVKSGSPTGVFPSGRLQLHPNDFLIRTPQTRWKWEDQSDAVSDLFIWIWETPPRCADCRPKDRGFLHVTLRSSESVELQNIHAAGRKELAAVDPHSAMALEHLRLWLDVTVARAIQRGDAGTESVPPANRIIAWMEQNISDPYCASLLCDYFQITNSQLHRLFLEQTGKAPSVYFNELKMKAAEQMLRNGRMVKETASELGYHYANDFSRAFKAITGKSPAQISAPRRERKLAATRTV